MGVAFRLFMGLLDDFVPGGRIIGRFPPGVCVEVIDVLGDLFSARSYVSPMG
ncbi:hypothetical protein [Pasteuria penetrans]|uniref:hypothetical protein n=1 Tax=Pasteuria penetrans TaxID=86005 RepID=UPI00165A9FD3|nr:hypothetical protein [Pasteuria penetrans]